MCFWPQKIEILVSKETSSTNSCTNPMACTYTSYSEVCQHGSLFTLCRKGHLSKFCFDRLKFSNTNILVWNTIIQEPKKVWILKSMPIVFDTGVGSSKCERILVLWWWMQSVFDEQMNGCITIKEFRWEDHFVLEKWRLILSVWQLSLSFILCLHML